VGPKAGLDAVVKRKIPSPRSMKTNLLVSILKSQHYVTDIKYIEAVTA
jgi:hypothetical protein